ncbi:MAG: hypothetical protein BMS9Abin23_0875 [Thermodesulfobacteriota bacterium]|nr:MAG: hypothetical protein BMS9Abin23_0875 [Thermodesulfobacteriota bacterium]
MGREIRIRITKDGRVEIDSTVYKDCKDVAEQLTRDLGEIVSFEEKDDFDTTERVKIDTEK